MLFASPEGRNSKRPLSAPKCSLRAPMELHVARCRVRCARYEFRCSCGRRAALSTPKCSSGAPMELHMGRCRLRNARYDPRWSFTWVAAGSEMLVTSSDKISNISPSPPTCPLRAPMELHVGRCRFRNARQSSNRTPSGSSSGSRCSVRAPTELRVARLRGRDARCEPRRASNGSSLDPKYSLRVPMELHVARCFASKAFVTCADLASHGSLLRLRDARYEFRRSFAWLFVKSEMLVTSPDRASPNGSLSATECSLRVPTELQTVCLRPRDAGYEFHFSKKSSSNFSYQFVIKIFIPKQCVGNLYGGWSIRGYLFATPTERFAFDVVPFNNQYDFVISKSWMMKDNAIATPVAIGTCGITRARRSRRAKRMDNVCAATDTVIAAAARASQDPKRPPPAQPFLEKNHH